jgi:hypothetical protein
MVLSAPVWAANPGVPGSINYVEGQVRLDGRVLGPNAVGGAGVLGAGQVLETQQGKAEVLLTPGVFLRLGNNSAVRMDSPELVHTKVAVLRGNAMVEVDELYKQNNLQIQTDGTVATLAKRGLYAFQADPSKVQVIDGEAEINMGDRHKTIKKGHEVYLNAGVLKVDKFDRKEDNDLYAWSSLRSEYLSEASASSARTYVVDSGAWFGGGWYWNPWFGAYSFLPGNGYLFSPFGWGFYSPAFAYYAPFYGGGYYGGVYRGGRGGFASGRAITAGRGFTARSAPAFHSGFSGAMGFHGGGFGGGRR